MQKNLENIELYKDKVEKFFVISSKDSAAFLESIGCFSLKAEIIFTFSLH